MPDEATDNTTPIICPGKLFLDPTHFEAHFRDIPLGVLRSYIFDHEFWLITNEIDQHQGEGSRNE